MKKMTIDELIARQREINDTLGELQGRELNEDEKKTQKSLLAEYENNKREIDVDVQEKKAAAVALPVKTDVNAELREFILEAKPGRQFQVPMTRSAMSTSDTASYVQGVTIVDLISTDRPDNDILLTAGVPMTTGVTGNAIQWAFAGGVEAAFANELAATTERKVSLSKQTPVQQRLTVRVRISNQALENSSYDLQGYIVRAVQDSIKKKVNFALASTTKATATFYGPFAQSAESGTYGADGYTAGKQTGTYTTFDKTVAAEMLAKLAKRNIDTDNTVFVMGAEDFWALKVTGFDQGSGIMLIDNDNRMLGVPVVVNNAINRSSETGTISGHNIGLGNFKYVPVMQHGNVRLSIDATSATASNTDEVYVTINADFSMTILKDGADAFVVYSKTGTTTTA